jgi:DNA-binding beta-propeller fold protein YncE
MRPYNRVLTIRICRVLAVGLLLVPLAPAWAQTVVATTTVPVGHVPIAIAVNAVTNKIYVANRGIILKNIRGSVTVINGATNSTATVRDPNATFPLAVAVNSVTDKVYVTNASHNVTVHDGRTNSTTTVRDPNAAFPVAVAVNAVTNKICVANVDSANVTVIDGATIPLKPSQSRPPMYSVRLP